MLGNGPGWTGGRRGEGCAFSIQKEEENGKGL